MNESAAAHCAFMARTGRVRARTCDYPEQEGGGVVRPHQAVDGLEEPLQRLLELGLLLPLVQPDGDTREAQTSAFGNRKRKRKKKRKREDGAERRKANVCLHPGDDGGACHKSTEGNCSAS